MIEVSVGLPLFNSKHIAWLALESLCNQKEILFDWELIIIEESNDLAFGENNILEYKERLENVGCKRLVYTSLEEWIPLSYKWKMISNYTSEESKYFLFQAADNYSQPFRLKQTYNAFEESNCDWVSFTKILFYLIKTEEVIVCDQDKVKIKTKLKFLPSFNMSTKTKYMRQLPDEYKEKGVDAWTINNILSEKSNFHSVKIRSNTWKEGIHTHGLNTLSLKRGPKLKQRYSERLTKKDLIGYIPSYILYKLKKLKKIAIF